jgi:hypothetical protein
MKQLIVPLATLSLIALAPLGCIYVQPPERVVYTQPPPPQPQPQPDVSEQYVPQPAPQPAEPTVEVTAGPDIQVTDFQDQLAPYGHWVAVDGYGNCWVPAGIAVGWRPYTIGHWVYTDFGMAWVSDEQWGWATYHYGRWTLVDGVGWAWIPGSRWGPAWVAWRHGGGYCGWAPLPPGPGGVEVVEVNDEQVEAISPVWFSFCEERNITAPHIYQQCLPPERNVTIINVTKNITKITVVNNRIVNRSWNPARLQQATGRVVRPVRVHRVASVEELKVAHARTLHPADQREHPEAAPEAGEHPGAAPGPGEHPGVGPEAGEHHPDEAAVEADRHPPGDDQSRVAYEAEVKNIEDSYAKQRADMSQRFAMERRQHPPGPGADDLAAKQDAQMKDLEKHHQQDLENARKKYHQ